MSFPLPQASLLVAGVLLGNATLSTLIEGISWAIENDAHIINMSFGLSYYEPKFEEVLKPLRHYNILPVVAIGNDNHGNTSSPGNAANALSSDVVTVLKETARHPGGHRGRPDNRWRYGMIRPKEALSALSS